MAQNDLLWWYPGGPASGLLIHLKWAAHARSPVAPIPVAEERGRAPAGPPPRGRGGPRPAGPVPASSPAPDVEAYSGNFEPPLIGSEQRLPGYPHGIRLVAPPAGLIITASITGLWFIPNQDLHAYRAASTAVGAPSEVGHASGE